MTAFFQIAANREIDTRDTLFDTARNFGLTEDGRDPLPGRIRGEFMNEIAEYANQQEID